MKAVPTRDSKRGDAHSYETPSEVSINRPRAPQQLRLGAAARATVQQRFTIESSVTAYEQLVISLKLAATKA